MQKRNLRTGRFLWLGSAVILLGVPFHAILTAWFASAFGHFDLIRLWKEVILLCLVICAGVLVVRHPALRRDLKHSKTVQLMLGFIGFCAVMALYGLATGHVSLGAAVYGLIIDTRPFVFLLVVLVAGHLAPLPLTRRRWILLPAVVVIAFGLLQQFVLAPDFLRHFGYGANTLPAFQPVDANPHLARVQSTLRGPNPLGAYLVVIIMSFIGLAVANKKRRTLAIVAAVAGTIVLYGSYSRSAAGALVVALAAFGYWSLESRRAKSQFFGVVAVCFVLGSGLLFGLRHNDTFQNIVFHTNEKSVAASTNNVRLSALNNGVQDITQNPFGDGVGSAGPASLRNKLGSPRIAENFYLQVGQETGIVGLLLFLGSLGAVARVLFRRRSDVLMRAALASLLGVVLINMVSHAFADDTMAYVLFAAIGFAFITSHTDHALAKQLTPKKS